MMARIAIVSLNCDGMRLANDMAIFGQNFGKSIPIIRIEYAVF
jgi:hypothetical protein